MSVTLIPFYLKMLNEGIRYPIKVSEDKWDEGYKGYQDILKSLCVMTLSRKAFLKKYESLPSLETVSNEEKVNWRKFVNEIFPDENPEFRLEAMKIIYTIGVLTNE